MKSSMKILAMACWTLVHHRLSPIYGDNVLSPYIDSLVVSIIEGYDIDIAMLITREIHDRVVA